MTAKDLYEHLQSHTENFLGKTSPCEICGKLLKNKYSLKVHLESFKETAGLLLIQNQIIMNIYAGVRPSAPSQLRLSPPPERFRCRYYPPLVTRLSYNIINPCRHSPIFDLGPCCVIYLLFFVVFGTCWQFISRLMLRQCMRRGRAGSLPVICVERFLNQRKEEIKLTIE